MTAATEFLLQVQDVYKAFILPGKQALKAVNGVNLDLRPGERLSLVGESGCGKSTLARMIAGIEPASKGSIRFAGEPIDSFHGEALRQYRRKVQIIFQDPSAVFSPRMRIGAFLCEPFLNFGILSKNEALAKACQLLESVELPEDFLRRYPHQLSGGELQRVAIARAMGVGPLLLICDEPTSALDVSIQKSIIALLEQMCQNYRVSMLFISHDLALVNHFSDRVAVMYLGSILEILPGAHIQREAKHPYTRALLQSSFQIGKERTENTIDPNSEPPSPLRLPAGCPYCANCGISVELCRQTLPPLREISPGHSVACHLL